MRIAMVSEHASPLAVLGGEDAGGQNVHVAALALALAERGHDVEVYTRRDSRELPERVSLGDGVDVVHVPAGPPESIPKDDLLPYMASFGRWLARNWTARPPDVVHAHFWMSGIACLEAGCTPLAQTFHALGVVKRRYQGAKDTSPAARLDLESGLARRVDAVIATSTDEVRELLELGARAEAMHVVPCGVDLDLFASAAEPDSSWWYGDSGRILSLGRLVERKGVDTVVHAVAQLPGVELVIAGGPVSGFESDPEVRRLRAEVDRLGVADRVRFVGSVSRELVPPLIRSADLVACVPWYEPFGIVPLEAMAAGRPVVAAAVGGLLDTVVDGVTGVHVPPRDPDRLASVFAELLADPSRRAAMGAAGLQRVTARYSWRQVAEDTEEVYQRLVARAKVRSR